jgi:hypothetical protein
MANLDSDMMAAQSSVSIRNRPLATRVEGQLWVAEPVYVTTALEVTADIIRWFILPIGAKVLPENCWFISEGTGGTSVVITSFGDEGDDDRYATADIALTAASSAKIAVTPLVANMLTRYPVVEASKTLVTPITGTFPMTINKKVVGHFEYLMY